MSKTQVNKQINLDDVLKKSVKLLLEGLVIGVCTKLLPGNKITIQHILMITLITALIFGLLDAFAPELSSSVRWGAGIGIGYSIVGLIPSVVLPVSQSSPTSPSISSIIN